MSEYERLEFYKYAMELFVRAGHTSNIHVIFANHTPEQFFYTDFPIDSVFSSEERSLFSSISNVSLLFQTNDCSFVSACIEIELSYRSVLAHDVHTLIRSMIDSSALVCIFRCEDSVVLSFSGYGRKCILSDWYPIDDDYDYLEDCLSVANMGIDNNEKYFFDMVYSLARHYYTQETPLSYDGLPIYFLADHSIDICREDIDEAIEYELTTARREYGDDYVEYSETNSTRREDIQRVLDILILSLDEENKLGSDELTEAPEENSEKDEYEFEDVDQKIFQDANLMVKWLNKHI